MVDYQPDFADIIWVDYVMPQGQDEKNTPMSRLSQKKTKTRYQISEKQKSNFSISLIAESPIISVKTEIAIKHAKKYFRKSFASKITWGQGYKTIMKNIIGLPMLCLMIDGMEKATREFFLTNPNIRLW